jgi:hypothetical protein
MTIKRATSSRPEALRRSDRAGHLDPAYADELRALGGSRAAPDAVPFFDQSYTADAFAEQLGEQTVEAATSGEDHALDDFDDNVPEDTLSPFDTTDTSAEQEEEEE